MLMYEFITIQSDVELICIQKFMSLLEIQRVFKKIYLIKQGAFAN